MKTLQPHKVTITLFRGHITTTSGPKFTQIWPPPSPRVKKGGHFTWYSILPIIRTMSPYILFRYQIKGDTRLLIFRKFSILANVIWAYPFINFQENFQPPCFSPTQMRFFSILPNVIKAYQSTNYLLNLKKNSSLLFC